jgi:hypothetical protein
MAMHGEHMEAQPPMGLKGGSGEGASDHIRFRVRFRAGLGKICQGVRT